MYSHFPPRYLASLAVYQQEAKQTQQEANKTQQETNKQAISDASKVTVQESKKELKESKSKRWRKLPRRASDKSASACWLLTESNEGFKRPTSKRWRKFQRLASQNSAFASRLNFYPNGRPRTRPAPHHYPSSVVKEGTQRGTKRGVVDPIPSYKVGQTCLLVASCFLGCRRGKDRHLQQVEAGMHDDAIRIPGRCTEVVVVAVYCALERAHSATLAPFPPLVAGLDQTDRHRTPPSRHSLAWPRCFSSDAPRKERNPGVEIDSPAVFPCS